MYVAEIYMFVDQVMRIIGNGVTNHRALEVEEHP
jgi:hypothetical protein